MVSLALKKRNDYSSTTLTAAEILPQTTPSTSFKPSTLSSVPSTTTTATKSQVNSPPPTSSSSKPLISSSSSSVSSSVPLSSSSVPSFSSSVPSFSSTLSPPTSSGVDSSQITKSLSASSSLHSGAIAGIVIACVVVSLVGIFFAVRAWFKKRASRLRKNWVGSFVGVDPFHETPGNVKTRSVLSVQIPSAHVSVPPASFNNDAIFQHSTSPGTSSSFSSTSPVYSPGLTNLSPYATTVVCAFIPSLPDELTIFVGESLHVLAGYEDGWSLCMDCRGKQGMVPNECLDESPSSMGLLLPSNDFRVSKNSTRVSSLAQAVRHVR